MNIMVRQVQGRVPVTVMQLQGELDASSYLDVIAQAKEAHRAGARDILLDLSNMTFMSSSGLVALHSIALLMRGEEPPDPESGWSAFHAIAHDVEDGFQMHCKLLNPQPRVDKTLEMTGFKSFLPVYTDLDTAVASF